MRKKAEGKNPPPPFARQTIAASKFFGQLPFPWCRMKSEQYLEDPQLDIKGAANKVKDKYFRKIFALKWPTSFCHAATHTNVLQ